MKQWFVPEKFSGANAPEAAEGAGPTEPPPPVLAPADVVELTDTAVVGEEGEEEAPEDDDEIPDLV